MDQPGKVANPALSLSAFAPENLVSRDGLGSPVPRQPAHLHTQAEAQCSQQCYCCQQFTTLVRSALLYVEQSSYSISSVDHVTVQTISAGTTRMPVKALRVGNLFSNRAKMKKYKQYITTIDLPLCVYRQKFKRTYIRL